MRRISTSCQVTFAVDLLLERLAVDALHHEIRQAVLIDGVDRDDVLVDDGCRGLGLAHEPLAGGWIGGQLGRQHLDGDDAVELRVVGLENHAHAAAAEYFQNLVVSYPPDRCGLGRRTREIEHLRFRLAGRELLARCEDLGRRRFEKAAPLAMVPEQSLDTAAQLGAGAAFPVQEGGLLLGRTEFERP